MGALGQQRDIYFDLTVRRGGFSVSNVAAGFHENALQRLYNIVSCMVQYFNCTTQFTS